MKHPQCKPCPDCGWLAEIQPAEIARHAETFAPLLAAAYSPLWLLAVPAAHLTEKVLPPRYRCRCCGRSFWDWPFSPDGPSP